MGEQLQNPWRGAGLGGAGLGGAGLEDPAPLPLAEAQDVARLLAQCPAHLPTPLHDAPRLAAELGIARLWLKDERARMGLGSFKALGAAHAIARDAATSGIPDLRHALQGRVYVTASAGNHGLSVAAGARLFGARAVIYLADSVPASFATRLQDKGAEVIRAGADYEASCRAAAAAATTYGWTLLSDSSWPGYTEWPTRVMEGYLQLAAEAAQQIDTPPSHILLQAGVGGLAAAVAAHARLVWGDAPRIIVVEPAAAPALIDSIRAGRMVDTSGPPSCMGRLDCKTPSWVALNGLARDADVFVTISEEEARHGADRLAAHGWPTTESGGAGVAALVAGLDMPPGAQVLAILSEAPGAG